MEENTEHWMALETAVNELLDDGEDPGDVTEAVDGWCDEYGQEDTAIRLPKPKKQ